MQETYATCQINVVMLLYVVLIYIASPPHAYSLDNDCIDGCGSGSSNYSKGTTTNGSGSGSGNYSGGVTTMQDNDCINGCGSGSSNYIISKLSSASYQTSSPFETSLMKSSPLPLTSPISSHSRMFPSGVNLTEVTSSTTTPFASSTLAMSYPVVSPFETNHTESNPLPVTFSPSSNHSEVTSSVTPSLAPNSSMASSPARSPLASSPAANVPQLLELLQDNWVIALIVLSIGVLLGCCACCPLIVIVFLCHRRKKQKSLPIKKCQ